LLNFNDVVWLRLQGMAESVKFIPWSWIPAVHKGDWIRATYLLRHEFISTRPSDFVHMWIRYRQNWLRGWDLLLHVAHSVKYMMLWEKLF